MCYEYDEYLVEYYSSLFVIMRMPLKFFKWNLVEKEIEFENKIKHKWMIEMNGQDGER